MVNLRQLEVVIWNLSTEVFPVILNIQIFSLEGVIGCGTVRTAQATVVVFNRQFVFRDSASCVAFSLDGRAA